MFYGQSPKMLFIKIETEPKNLVIQFTLDVSRNIHIIFCKKIFKDVKMFLKFS